MAAAVLPPEAKQVASRAVKTGQHSQGSAEAEQARMVVLDSVAEPALHPRASAAAEAECQQRAARNPMAPALAGHRDPRRCVEAWHRRVRALRASRAQTRR